MGVDALADFSKTGTNGHDSIGLQGFLLARHAGPGAISAPVTASAGGASIAGTDIAVWNIGGQSNDKHSINDRSEMDAFPAGQQGSFDAGVLIIAYKGVGAHAKVVPYVGRDANASSAGADVSLIAILDHQALARKSLQRG